MYRVLGIDPGITMAGFIIIEASPERLMAMRRAKSPPARES